MTGGVAARMRRGWLTVLKHTLNRATLRAARSGRGPFSLVRHRGRSSGRVYETPLILAETDGGLVAELTYGPDVNWYRNIVAAGGCEVVHRGRTVRIDGIEPMSATAGLAAYGPPASVILRLLRREHFIRLRIAAG